MTTQQVKRKLAAILSADVKGYSRLMGEEEKGTIRTLTAYKEAMSSLTYKGKPMNVQQVSRELGVKYGLEGSIREAGGRIWIIAQLIDSATGPLKLSPKLPRTLQG
jgi:hypothetical protein